MWDEETHAAAAASLCAAYPQYAVQLKTAAKTGVLDLRAAGAQWVCDGGVLQRKVELEYTAIGEVPLHVGRLCQWDDTERVHPAALAAREGVQLLRGIGDGLRKFAAKTRQAPAMEVNFVSQSIRTQENVRFWLDSAGELWVAVGSDASAVHEVRWVVGGCESHLQIPGTKHTHLYVTLDTAHLVLPPLWKLCSVAGVKHNIPAALHILDGNSLLVLFPELKGSSLVEGCAAYSPAPDGTSSQLCTIHLSSRPQLPVGTRVQRNSTWRFAFQDGGAGRQGSVSPFFPGTYLVSWDVGRQFYYGFGAADSYDIRPTTIPSGHSWWAARVHFREGPPGTLPRDPSSWQCALAAMKSLPLRELRMEGQDVGEMGTEGLGQVGSTVVEGVRGCSTLTALGLSGCGLSGMAVGVCTLLVAAQALGNRGELSWEELRGCGEAWSAIAATALAPLPRWPLPFRNITDESCKRHEQRGELCTAFMNEWRRNGASTVPAGGVLLACADGSAEEVQQLLDAGADPGEADSEGMPGLYHAICRSSWDVAGPTGRVLEQLCTERSLFAASSSSSGWTSLYKATYDGRPWCLAAMLRAARRVVGQRGLEALVNKADRNDGLTPLGKLVGDREGDDESQCCLFCSDERHAMYVRVCELLGPVTFQYWDRPPETVRRKAWAVVAPSSLWPYLWPQARGGDVPPTARLGPLVSIGTAEPPTLPVLRHNERRGEWVEDPAPADDCLVLCGPPPPWPAPEWVCVRREYWVPGVPLHPRQQKVVTAVLIADRKARLPSDTLNTILAFALADGRRNGELVVESVAGSVTVPVSVVSCNSVWIKEAVNKVRDEAWQHLDLRPGHKGTAAEVSLLRGAFNSLILSAVQSLQRSADRHDRSAATISAVAEVVRAQTFLAAAKRIAGQWNEILADPSASGVSKAAHSAMAHVEVIPRFWDS
eukprot:Hpha_TRINITY_DN25920_c0_g1::TRINITY_DN25920_c0_g1_i1::g.185442::m.185442